MSCCNFNSRRDVPFRGSCQFGGRLDDRRDCCSVNWGLCRDRDNRFCPRRRPSRGPSRPRPYRP